MPRRPLVLLMLAYVFGCARPRAATKTPEPAACPEGTHLQGDACVANVDTSCPAGMHFVEGTGCVADIVATETTQTPAAVPLHWVGEWAGNGVKFSFDIRLGAKGNTVDGKIRWTLVAVPPGHFLTARVGDSAHEFVTGTWSPATRELHLTGTSVDDKSLLATDEYKLIVSADGSTFDGRTRGNKGDWMNEIRGTRGD